MKKTVGFLLVIVGILFLFRGVLPQKTGEVLGDGYRDVAKRACPAIGIEHSEAVKSTVKRGQEDSTGLFSLVESESRASSFRGKDDIALDAYSELLLERALRESQNEAKKVAKNLMREMLAPVQANERSFANKLYDIMSAARGLGGSDEEYRAYVADRFSKEILANGILQENLVAISEEYLYALQRISNQVAIDSGRDLASLPEIEISDMDFEEIIRNDATNCMGAITTVMVHEARTSASVNTALITGAIIVPTPWYIDIPIGFAVDHVIEKFRDPTGNVAIGAIASAEQLTEAICFGTEDHMGFYQYMLNLSQFHNDQLRGLLMHSDGMSSMRGDTKSVVFSEDNR